MSGRETFVDMLEQVDEAMDRRLGRSINDNPGKALSLAVNVVTEAYNGDTSRESFGRAVELMTNLIKMIRTKSQSTLDYATFDTLVSFGFLYESKSRESDE